MACPCALCIRHRERPQSKLLPYATLLRSCWLTCLSNSSWGHLPFPTTAAPHHRVLISHHPGWPLHPGVPSTVQEFLGFSTEKYNFLWTFLSLRQIKLAAQLTAAISDSLWVVLKVYPVLASNPNQEAWAFSRDLSEMQILELFPWSTEAETGGVIACYPTQNLCFHKVSRWSQGTGKLRSHASKQVVTSDPSAFFCLQRFSESCMIMTSWSDKLTMARCSWW